MKRFGAILLLILPVGFVAAAQLKVDVGLVNVVATVLDDRGRYVPDLGPENFILYEDGEEQTIRHFEYSRNLPVSVGVLLDTSGSMERKIGAATDAVERFLRQIHEDDDIFLVTFDDRARLREDFTDDRTRLGSALRRIRVGGGTALYDAVALGVDQIRAGRHDKKALLLISDGEDTSSATSFDRALSAVRESEILVYALGIAAEAGAPLSERVPGVSIPTTPRFPFPGTIPGTSPPTFPTGGGGGPRVQTGPGGRADALDMEVMERFSTISGGRTWLVSSGSDSQRDNQIADALDELADELRSQYSIGYYPPHPLDDGKWHRVDIVTPDLDFRVRSRGDYFGDSDSN